MSELDAEADKLLAEILIAYESELAAGKTTLDDLKALFSDAPLEFFTRAENVKKCLTLLNDVWPCDPQMEALAPKEVSRFPVLRELGRGGFGVVYLVRDDALGRAIALKVQRPEAILSETLRRRFRREAHAAARLRHPNIAAIYEVSKEELQLWFASEYCDGGSLDEWITAQQVPIPPRDAAATMAVLADAVEYSHHQKVLHRDLKPTNVLLQRRDPAVDLTQRHSYPLSAFTPKLIDFGLAKWEGGERHDTHSGTMLGTPAYMAPEQANSEAGEVGPATDVYGLGAILYELLTGTAVFPGHNQADTLRRIATEQPESLRRLRPDIPRDLEAICLKCLQKQASKRYPTAAALAADLRRFCAGTPTEARPLTPLERLTNGVARRPALASGLTVLTIGSLAFIALTAAYVWQLMAAQTRLEQANLTADSLRIAAQTSAAESRAQERTANQFLYASRMRICYEALEQGDTEQIDELLSPYESEQPLADLRGFEWFHLKRRLHSEKLTLQGHRGQAYVVAFAPSGELLASGGQDGTIKFWDPNSGREQGSIDAHQSCVNTLAYSADGKTLASGSCDGAIKLWDATTRELSGTLADHPSNVQSVAFFPGDRPLLASGGNDPLVRIWDLTTQQVVKTLDTKMQTVVAVVWQPGTTTLMCSAVQPPAHVASAVFTWNIETDEQSSVPAQANALAIAPDGTHLVLGLTDYTVRKSTLDFTDSVTLQKHNNQVSAVAFSPRGQWVASGGNDRTIRIWDMRTNRCIHTLVGHAGRVQSVAFAPTGLTLASASFDGTVKLWSADSAGRLVLNRDVYVPPGQILEHAVALSHDFRYLAFATEPDKVAVLRMADWQVLGQLPLAVTHSLNFEIERPVLVGASSQASSTLDAWDVVTWKSIGRRAIPDGFTHAKPSGDGSQLALGGTQRVALIDALADRTWCTIEVAPEDSEASLRPELLLSADGKHLAVVLPHEQGWLVELNEQGKRQRVASGLAGLSNRAELLAIRGEAQQIRLVEAKTGRRLATLRHNSSVHATAFSDDDRTLATICSNGSVYLWNVSTGQEIAQLETDPTQTPGRIQFSADGKQLAAVTYSQTPATVASHRVTAHLYLWSGLSSEP